MDKDKPEHLGLRIARGFYILLQAGKTIQVIGFLVITICATAGLRLMKDNHPFYDYLYISREDKIPVKEIAYFWTLFIIFFLLQIVFWKVLFVYSSHIMIAAMVINTLGIIVLLVRVVAFDQYFYILTSFFVILETLTIWYMYRTIDRKPEHLGFQIVRGFFIYVQISKTVGVIVWLVIAICATAGLRLLKNDNPYYDYFYISREDKIPLKELTYFWILFVYVFLLQIPYWKILFRYNAKIMIAAMVITTLRTIIDIVRVVVLGQYIYLLTIFVFVSVETLTILYMYRTLHRKPKESVLT